MERKSPFTSMYIEIMKMESPDTASSDPPTSTGSGNTKSMPDSDPPPDDPMTGYSQPEEVYPYESDWGYGGVTSDPPTGGGGTGGG